MSKTRHDSRLYALRRINIGEWGGDSVPQSTVAWVCCKKNRQKTYISSKSGNKKIKHFIYIWQKPDLTLVCTRYYTQTFVNGEGILCLNRL